MVRWNESSTLIVKINGFLKTNNINYKNIKNIVAVNWPWSFTWIRTIVLVVNSISYLMNTNLTELSYFDLFEDFPIVKSSSKRDCFFQLNKDCKIEVIDNDELDNILSEQKINKLYWEYYNIKAIWTEVLENIDYKSIIKNIKLDNLKQISAMYIKKPNIS